MKSALRARTPVQHLVQASFDQFKNDSPLAIVLVFRVKRTRFLQPVAEHFVAEYPGTACGEIDLSPIVFPSWAERHIGPREQPWLTWPVGYHLFANGEPIAYHTGERPNEGEQVLAELGVQLIPALLFDSNAGMKAIEDKKQREQATAVILEFEKVLGERASTSAPSNAQAKVDPWAVLGVDPSVGDEELVQAYRHLVSEYHPDLVARAAPEIRELANTRLTEINGAWQTVGQIRGL